jgi:cytochrome P450
MEVRKKHGVCDVFGQLLAPKDPDSQAGDRLSALDMRTNSMNLLVAGSDTSFRTLAATFLYLSRNRDAYNQTQTVGIDVSNASFGQPIWIQ